MNADFILVATGDVTTPTIHHMIFGTLDGAKMEATRVVKKLHTTGGYKYFSLFDAQRTDSQAEKLIATFTATVQAPLVICHNEI